MAEAECGECKKKFSRKDSLRTHAKKMHPEKVDILAPKTEKKVGSHICIECQETFSNFGNLRVHIKKKHPEQLEEIAPIKKKIFKCAICQSEFVTLKAYNVHKKTHKAVKMLNCPLCSQSYSLTGDIIRHYTDEHTIKIENETIEFTSFDDFQAWKATVEKDTFASFVTRHGFYENPTTNIKKIHYMCHRSGDVRRRGSNIKSLKTQGSNKINAYCPANMNVRVEENKCRVTFCKTHIGHKQEEDMGHLFLSTSDKQTIAVKIAAKMPLDTILDEVRDTVSDRNLQRIHLLTRQDLYNIEKAYNLNKTSIRHKNDAVAHKGKVCTKLADLRQRHKTSQSLDISKVVPYETGWIVPSTSKKEIYVIEELQADCTCKLVCNECKACIHKYTCTCLDSSVKWNMCKHIHLLAQYLIKNPPTPDEGEAIFSENELVIDANQNQVEVAGLVEAISTTTNDAKHEIEERKRKFLQLIQDELSKVSTSEEMDAVEKMYAPMKPTLAAVRSQQQLAKNFAGESSKTPSYKKN